MRITIVQGAFLPVPPLRGGAVEKIWHALGLELAARGHEVTHISRKFSGLPDDEKVGGVRYLRVAGYEPPAHLLHLKLLDLIYSLRVRRILPEADLLVTNTFWLPVLVRTRKYGHLYVHVQRYPRGQMKYYRHAARLQTVSPSLAEAIRQRVPECTAKIRMIANPLLENLRVDESRLPTSAARQGFLFVGRIHPEKGVDLLLQAYLRYAAAQASPWDLTILGPWEVHLGGAGKEYFNRLAEQIPVSFQKSVHWAGFVSESGELKKRLSGAGLFIYPTVAAKGEASPVAPLEAMGCGCPVLVSNLDCFQGLIDDGKTGFIFDHEAEDPVEALAVRMGELAGNSVLRDEVARRAWQLADTLALPKIADQYEADFKRILHGEANA